METMTGHGEMVCRWPHKPELWVRLPLPPHTNGLIMSMGACSSCTAKVWVRPPIGPLTMKIILYPDPRLKQKCAEVTDINKELRDTVEEMMFLCQNNVCQGIPSQALGLAAPQVGIMKTFFVCHLYPSVVINPIITKRKGRVNGVEGCLSIPGERFEIWRPKKITVNGFLITGKEFTREYTGMDARIMSHEIDHLFGKLIND